MSRQGHKEEERIKAIGAKMQVPESGDWVIEYEIPPLRTIYFAALYNATLAQLFRSIQAQNPPWKIREISRKTTD